MSNNSDKTEEQNRAQSQTFYSQEDVVDIWNLFKIVWDERRYIIYFAGAFFLLGLFHISFGPSDEYVSNSVLLEESSSGSSSPQRFLQQFGGVFGFNSSGSEGGSISSELYPFIIESASFQHELINEEIEFSEFDESITLKNYFNEIYEEPIRDKVYNLISTYTIYLPKELYDYIVNFSLFQEKKEVEEEIVEYDDRLLNLSSEESGAMSELTSRITLTIDGALITVETQLPDPEAAAMFNVLVIEKIQEYITEYKIEKAQSNLEFIQEQHERAKEQYESAQNELAEFLDQNLNLSSNVARVEEERLQNQVNRVFNIYNSIALDLEQAKLRLQEETPVFSIMQKSSLPTIPIGGSNRILFLFAILGAFFGLFYIFAKRIYNRILLEISSK